MEHNMDGPRSIANVRSRLRTSHVFSQCLGIRPRADVGGQVMYFPLMPEIEHSGCPLDRIQNLDILDLEQHSVCSTMSGIRHDAFVTLPGRRQKGCHLLNWEPKTYTKLISSYSYDIVIKELDCYIYIYICVCIHLCLGSQRFARLVVRATTSTEEATTTTTTETSLDTEELIGDLKAKVDDIGGERM
jgi:hypothetical protein